jgi:hypothetical protein
MAAINLQQKLDAFDDYFSPSTARSPKKRPTFS